MRIIFIIVPFILLMNCKENTLKEKFTSIKNNKSIKMDAVIDSVATTAINSKDENNSKTKLKGFSLQHLTAWGGLFLKYDGNVLNIIEATQNGELGFKKRIYYLNAEQIERIEFVVHEANWNEYINKYGNVGNVDESKMTYLDKSITYDLNKINKKYSKELEQLKNDGIQILHFIKTKNIDLSKPSINR